MRYRFHTADVFTDRVFGGNPLAVFPQAEGLDASLMQRVAGEINLSETVFVVPPEDPAHTRRLRIFTPRTELPFAGHPTIGCAHVLVRTGAVPLAGASAELVFEEGVGPVRVTVHAGARGGSEPGPAFLWAAQRPEYGPRPPARDALAQMLSLAPSEVLETQTARPSAVSCGVPFLLVPLSGREAVARARLRRERWEALLASFWAPHVYVFSHEPAGARAEVHARMFAPAMGIEEDPATGAAVAALAGYLVPRARTGTQRWRIEQGVEMGRPSLLQLEAEVRDGAPAAIRVGGASVAVSEGWMDIPES